MALPVKVSALYCHSGDVCPPQLDAVTTVVDLCRGGGGKPPCRKALQRQTPPLFSPSPRREEATMSLWRSGLHRRRRQLLSTQAVLGWHLGVLLAVTCTVANMSTHSLRIMRAPALESSNVGNAAPNAWMICAWSRNTTPRAARGGPSRWRTALVFRLSPARARLQQMCLRRPFPLCSVARPNSRRCIFLFHREQFML